MNFMKNLIVALILVLVLQNCSSNSIKDEFLGNWSSTNYSNIVDFQFFKDSLVIHQWGNSTLNLWDRDDSKIYITQLKGDGPEIDTSYVLQFKLNVQKDTLFIKEAQDSDFNAELLKINNAYQYFQKNINLDINLPNKEDEIISSGNKRADYNIFVGYKNEKLIARTENYYSLNGVISDVILHLSSLNDEDLEQAKFMLFIDDAVPKRQIDSIKNLLKPSYIKKIFKVYTNNKVDYTKTAWRDEQARNQNHSIPLFARVM